MCYALLGKVELILITTCSIRIEVSGEDPQENADSDQHGVYDSVGKNRSVLALARYVFHPAHVGEAFRANCVGSAETCTHEVPKLHSMQTR